jgi:hypothetical protein
VMEAFAGAGRALLGSQVSASDLSDKNYRPWEGALFQAGMIIICIGYTFCFCECPCPQHASPP